jgi:hypothetical protein
MRLWSIHPKYMDTKGLVALWREGLLARKVLQGKTKGYRNHPQLDRFRESDFCLTAISLYLSAVFEESVRRGYNFDGRKTGPVRKTRKKIKVSDGQLAYEWKHFIGKLKRRAPADYRRLRLIEFPDPHPLFKIVKGSKAEWEK